MIAPANLIALAFFLNILIAISHITDGVKQYGSQHLLVDNQIREVVSDDEFFGLGTFANLPYLNCLSPSTEGGRYDIAIIGAPFDTVSKSSIVPRA